LSQKPSQKKKRNRALILWRRWGDWRKVSIAVITGLFIALLLTIPLLPDKVAVRVNELAPEDIVAHRYVRYPDHHRTEFLRQLVASQVPPQYSTAVGATGQVLDGVLQFLTFTERLRDDDEQPLTARVNLLLENTPDLNRPLARTALTLNGQQWLQAKEAARTLVEDVMAEPVFPDRLEQVRAGVHGRAESLPVATPAARLMGTVVAINLIPNQVYNVQETDEARKREMERVATQYETIRRGDLVVRQGEEVTEEHLVKLRGLGLIQERPDPWTAISRILLGFGLVAVFCLYLHQFHPTVFRSTNSLLLIAVVVCGSLLLFRIGSTALGLRFSGDQLGFIGMLSSATGAMLIAALLCPQIAVFVGVALAMLTSVLVGSELKFAILSIVSSLAGVQAVTNIRNRAGILRAGVSLSCVNVVAALVAHGATQSGLSEEMAPTMLPALVGQTATWATIGGFGSVLLFVLFAAWLERPFRLTTHLTLLELSDPSHPLLRRLAMEAPGTYAHSIIVGNLSEAGAEAIGADGLFCRIASYYHDVGKIIRPHFFIENQVGGDNQHNHINPSLSSLVVTAHVRDGVELAEEHRLPPPIINIIREHHGTCLIKYFYHRAMTQGGTEEPTPGLEYQFRYEGPRPQTKESGIIMIADSAEAASRTLEKPTPSRIRDLIDRIVRDRLADGQLDDCELTFKDLEKIISAMTRALTSLRHARIEYPSLDGTKLNAKKLGAGKLEGKMRKQAGNGAAHHEPMAGGEALADTPETSAGSFGRGADA
jgi:cyclic-di-AMP phosphodiesterase PgpH